MTLLAETSAERAARHAAYKDALERLRPMTAGEVRGAVQNLPVEIREKLAKGPHPRRWTCAVCQAFDVPATVVEADQSDARWLVFGYHEMPKCDMRHRDDQHYGDLANEVYRRCIEIYRAAGWTGEATEANA